MKISPSDGILNLIVTTNKSFWTFLSAGVHLLIYQEPRKHIFSMASDKFKVSFRRKPAHCQIDGDHIDLPKHIEIKIIHKGIKIVNYAG